MPKITIEVCEICKKEDCSGKIYLAYDEEADKMHRVCESQTDFIIRPDIYYAAVKAYEAAVPEARNTGVSLAPNKYLFAEAEKRGMVQIPVIREAFIGHAKHGGPKYATVHPKDGYEDLSIPFSQVSDGEIYNNGVKKISKVGK